MRPSCGRRFSTISMRASSLIRDVIAISTGVGNRVDLVQHAVDAEAHQAGVAPRLDVDVGGALLERVLPQPVDDVDDVAVVGVELARACPSSTSCSKLRASDTCALRRLLRLLHRAREVVELAQVAPDVLPGWRRRASPRASGSSRARRPRRARTARWSRRSASCASPRPAGSGSARRRRWTSSA